MGTRGCSVIDYIIVNEKMNDIVEEFRVDWMDSDHMPTEMIIKERRRKREDEKEKRKKENR